MGFAKARDAETTGALDEVSGRRSKRARSSVSTYNLKKLSEAQISESVGTSRNVSGLTGRTLVNDEEDDAAAWASKVDKDVDAEHESTTRSPRRSPPRKLHRGPSVRDRVKKVAGQVGTVLGKRGREVVEASKRKLGMKEEVTDQRSKKIVKELDLGSKGVLDELDLSDNEWDLPPARPAKIPKLSTKVALQDTRQIIPTAPPLAKSDGTKVKKWQKEGLYVGQAADFDPCHAAGKKKLQKKRPDSSSSEQAHSKDATLNRESFITMPMFAYLSKTRNFTIPFDVYAPSSCKGDEKPKDWSKINRNRLVGEARDLWERSAKLPASVCVCRLPKSGQQGCEDDCLNRIMQYECNDENCNLPGSQCSNRSFAELAARMKKGGAFDVGVEVVKTPDRGFGVRSCRTFAPGQIVMEYTGEIISEGECQRRMREDYKDKQCYYLMELERGLIIDGTKGSMARFINHSCAPNCEVRMMKVNGTPRMAVFAGDHGVMTREELTYDYNFDNFGTTQQKCYCGAPTCRGTLSKRLNANEQKKMAREENAKKRKATQEAQEHAESEARRKAVKTSRGSSWRGWIAVDEPETKERLRKEKREREEAEKNSSRALRMAARRQSLPLVEAASKVKDAVVKKSVSKRRKTVHVETTELLAGEPKMDDLAQQHDDTIEKPQASNETKPPIRTHKRTVSTTSKFTEDLPTPDLRASDVVKQTAISLTTTASLSSTATSDAHARASAWQNADEDALNEDYAILGTGLLDSHNEKARPGTATSSSTLSRTASKGKEALKSVGQAVKNGLTAAAARQEKAGGGSNGGRMKQSTLSFGRRTG